MAMFALLSRFWWAVVLRGAVAILFGLLALIVPAWTHPLLVLVFGAYAFADGGFAVVTAMAGSDLAHDWWVLLLQGLLGMAAGIASLFSPGVDGAALLFFVAMWAIAVGTLQVVAAVRLRSPLTGECWLGLGGMLGAAFGLVLLWSPAGSAGGVLPVLATYTIVWGVTLVIAGLDIHYASRQAIA
jgi:uncharacterized membrane protein HdeD (DUF308 family)